ncbi:hypothetical protein [Nocardia pseudovaccinii]|uniref:hypothetical protein n=1 Tax=Nocardia pseudovaccinii TaxID=189540 RepID=UPI0012F4D811|nr:hypothetical protein [Nocardia pseudovaccinii]
MAAGVSPYQDEGDRGGEHGSDDFDAREDKYSCKLSRGLDSLEHQTRDEEQQNRSDKQHPNAWRAELTRPHQRVRGVEMGVVHQWEKEPEQDSETTQPHRLLGPNYALLPRH